MLRAVALAGMALVLAIACGGDGQPDNPAATTTTTPREGITSTPGAPSTGKIAFTSARDGNDEVYVMNAAGSGQTNLTNNLLAADFEPAWSPDGTQITFLSNRDGNFEVYVMNADGSGQTRLTDDPELDRDPAWLPQP